MCPPQLLSPRLLRWPCVLLQCASHSDEIHFGHGWGSVLRLGHSLSELIRLCGRFHTAQLAPKPYTYPKTVLEVQHHRLRGVTETCNRAAEVTDTTYYEINNVREYNH